MEASKPEDTETEDAEGDQDYGSWSLRKRFKAEYVFIQLYLISICFT